jgi:transcriptional regulator with XRE-family HTH domain
MEERNGQVHDAREVGDHIRRLREMRGLSRRQLARKSGVRRSTVAAIERGRHTPTLDELDAIAEAVDVEPETLTPAPVVEFTLATGAGGGVRGQDAFDALLREYLAMVVDLRSGTRAEPDSLRQGDLSQLALALGGTPEAIEARLMQLLGSDEHEASELRAAIVPSSDERFNVAP